MANEMEQGGLIYLPPDRRLEAVGDSTTRRSQRANRAYLEVVKERNGVERAQVAQILARLKTLRTSLMARLLDNVTDFKRYTIQSLLRDVDREIEQVTAAMEQSARGAYERMAALGEDAADRPIKATQLTVARGLPGVDRDLVNTAFDNTVELLTQPMQQFAGDVKVALRQVALAGDNKFEAIQRLRDKIAGQGFDNAAYRAERIIRTELGRVFETANFDRLVGLSQTFKFLRKYWRATADSRTRLGHVEAARTYPRGGGIPVAQAFEINVYDERKGKDERLLGTASLRYPIDPNATPAGRLAAAATIMCRCGAVVDFDLADFAAYSAQQIQLALGTAQPAPGPVPVPATNIPKPTPKPKALTRRKRPAAEVPLKQVGPSGTPVSSAIRFDVQPNRVLKREPMASGLIAKVRKALAILDSVHGDGNLPQIPAVKLRRSTNAEAYYSRTKKEHRPLALSWGSRILGIEPNNAVFHEVGHFLDHVGFEPGDLVSFSSEVSPLFENWRRVVAQSKAMQTLRLWRNSTPGEGVAPLGVSRAQLDYMLTGREAWARAYAQYVMVKSGDPGVLKELRQMQRDATVGDVDRSRIYKGKLSYATPTNSWGYPWVWSDDDFKPIEEAIDSIMEALQWRKRK